jgi:hypothetical protein
MFVATFLPHTRTSNFLSSGAGGGNGLNRTFTHEEYKDTILTYLNSLLHENAAQTSMVVAAVMAPSWGGDHLANHQAT